MDEFGWGNTRLVIGEGGNKKVVVADDDKFDDSMIPLKKFSEYEAETWETGSHSEVTYRTGDTKPHSFLPPASRDHSPGRTSLHGSQAGDYYRDTNLTYNNQSNPNLRMPSQPPSISSHYGAPQQHMPSQFGSQPQLPFLPFGGGPGSAAGSDYGGQMPMMPPMGYQNTGSVYGMPMGGPRNTMFGGMDMGGGSQAGGFGGVPPSGSMMGMQQRPMSTFSMATTANLFAGPSMNANPSDEELFTALRNYLSTQDLMTVTKKYVVRISSLDAFKLIPCCRTAREAIMARFPKADLTSRKDFLNKSIDDILSQS